jgi:hypothetical protein
MPVHPADGTGGFAHQATCRTGSAYPPGTWKFQTKRIDCVGRLSERFGCLRHHRRPSGAGIEGKHLTNYGLTAKPNRSALSAKLNAS